MKSGYMCLVILFSVVCFCSSAKNIAADIHEEIFTPLRLSRSYRDTVETGHYRKRRSIEDIELHSDFESPVYNITAFGKSMILALKPDPLLISPNFQVSHSGVAINGSCGGIDPSRYDLQHCFYKGHVIDEEDSAVSMSLCDSMFGSITTKKYQYFIEPLVSDRKLKESNKLHLIRRRDPADGRSEPKEACGTVDSEPFYSEMDLAKKIESEQERSRQKRDIYSKEYYIEAMVVADQTMVEKYGSDLEHYLLTIMGGANRIFSHPSLGLIVSLSVTKIVVLDRYDDLVITEDADTLLTNFCSWQNRTHYRPPEHPDHYDVAVFFTDIDLSFRNSSVTLGMGLMGGMCTGYDIARSCAIVEDKGLSTSITLAHEIGHTFNMVHDEQVHCQKYLGEGNTISYVMKSTVADPTSEPWSLCSRTDIQEFFKNRRATCLENKPRRAETYPSELPGERYGPNQQCEFSFGKGSTACDYNLLQTCSTLWCNKPDDGARSCVTRSFNRADGTSCGEGMACFSGECESKTRRPRPINGGWGSWGSFGSCSRTCGGGVQFATRDCNNPYPENGGRLCLGNRRLIRSCRVQDCPDPNIDYRAQQCSQFNERRPVKPFADSFVSPIWVPKYIGIADEDRCKLTCTDNQTNGFTVWRQKVADGTPCSPMTTDICVDGTCMQAGCDRVLGSKAKFNKCGVCRGSRKLCKRIKGKNNDKKRGEKRLVVFPVGATNIVITQKSSKEYSDGNYLILQDDQDHYLFNTQIYINTEAQVEIYGGTIIKYSGAMKLTEIITTNGRPLTRELYLYLLSEKDINPKVKWSYYIRRTSRKRTKTDRNRVHTKSKIRVVEHDLTPEVDAADDRPRWVTGRWRKCKVFGDKQCGNGVARRSVLCKQGKNIVSTCNLREKPRTRQNCQIRCKSTRSSPTDTRRTTHTRNRVTSTEASWRTGPWSSCSVSCGLGYKKRLLKCVLNNGVVVDTSRCASKLQPSNTHGCKVRDCHG